VAVAVAVAVYGVGGRHLGCFFACRLQVLQRCRLAEERRRHKAETQCGEKGKGK
jgi:hypothetical protein